MNMELIHNYKRQAIFMRLSSLLKEYLIRFVNQNPEVFEALSRSGSPFGGNCLPARQQVSNLKTTEATQQQLASIKQQLEVLTDQVAQLTDQLVPGQSTAARWGKPIHDTATTASKQIGINRFWALKAQSHSVAKT